MAIKRMLKAFKVFVDYFPQYIETFEAFFRSNRTMMLKALQKKGVEFEVLPMKSNDEWRKNIQVGDILIMRYGGIWAPVLPNYLNHCAIFAGEGKVIESNENGVVENDISIYDMEVEAIEILRVKTPSRVRREAVAFMKSQLGKQYDVNWWHKRTDDRRWSCSELVWAAYWNSSLKCLDYPISLARDPGRYDAKKRIWFYDPHLPVSPTDIHLSEHAQFVSGYFKAKDKKMLVRKAK